MEKIMPKEIRIEIPEFIQEMKLSESRRTLYYKEGDEIPAKYTMYPDTYGFKKGKLYNLKTKKPVVRNIASAGKPRLKAIAGNDIWARVHPRIRMAMIDAIRENIKPYLPEKIDLKYPIQIDMEVHTPCRYCNWDIGNLWVYDKVFQDMLTPEKKEGKITKDGLIPDDNILYISKAGGARFIPVVGDHNRKLVFILREETDPRVLSHVMYDLQNIKKEIFYDNKYEYDRAYATSQHQWYHVIPTTNGEGGSIMIEHDKQIIWVSTGKKVSTSHCRKGFARAFSSVVQLNAHVRMKPVDFEFYHTYVQKEFIERGLTVHVYG